MKGGCWTHYISGEPQLRRVIFNRQSVWLHLRTSLICLCVCVYPPLSLVYLFGVFTFIRVRSAQHERILLIIWYYKYIPFSSFHFFLSLRFSAPLIDNWKKQTRWKRKHRNANGRSKAELKRWPHLFPRSAHRITSFGWEEGRQQSR